MICKRLIRLAKRILHDLIALPLYLVGLLIPRNKNIWVFGAWFGHRYADNSRYVYEYVCENEPGIKAIWLSRDTDTVQHLRNKGWTAYRVESLAGYWFSCRASVVFLTSGLDDVNRLGAFRCLVVQLWHGTPLKMIGFDDKKNNPDRSKAFRLVQGIWKRVFPYSYERYDYVISSSDTVTDRLQSAFGLDRSKILLTGYPRHDVVLRHDREEIPFLKQLITQWNPKKIVAFLPTFRDSRASLDIFSNLDWGLLEGCLANNDSIMLVKMHYCYRYCPNAGTPSGSRIYWVTEKDASDVNPILSHIDILITDYSSVYFDYLLLNRPIIFAPFDIQRYIQEDRELYEDYELATPGPKVYNWDQLINELSDVLQGVDEYSELRERARMKYNKFLDNDNCKRVVKAVKDLLIS